MIIKFGYGSVVVGRGKIGDDYAIIIWDTLEGTGPVGEKVPNYELYNETNMKCVLVFKTQEQAERVFNEI